MSAKEVKRRRGTKTQNDSFTGADGELTIDSTKHRVRVHDAVLAGGYSLLNANDIQNQAGVMGTVGGTANAITLTNDPVALSLTNLRVLFKATADNSGATTVTVDSLTTKNIYKASGGSVVALSGGEIKNGLIYELIYDGTQFQLGSGGGGGGVVVKRQVFTSSGTYTPDANMLYADVEIVGGGGGSGGGAGGGGSGGNTTFGSILTANGGGGGRVFSSGVSTPTAGGSASGGDVNITGGSSDCSPTGSTLYIGKGGSSVLGQGGASTASGATSGLSGTGYGAGASSAPFNTSNTAGSGGAGGYCRKVISKATIGASQTVTIGAAGSAGAFSSFGGAAGTAGVCIVTEYCSA